MAERKSRRSAPRLARVAILLIRAAGALPLSAARSLGAVLGETSALLPTEPRAVSDLNIRLSLPELGDPERRRLVNSSLRHAGRMLLELPYLWQRPVDRLEDLEGEVEGRELLQRALGSDRGTLLLLPHLGNWEVLNHYLARRVTLASLYRAPRWAELDSYIVSRRERTGIAMAPTTPAGVRTLLRILRAGGAVLILPDQEPLKAHGVWAPFFGIPALTMTLAASLLRRTGATPLLAVAEREREGRFTIRFTRPPEGLADADDLAAATALNRGVEACIRRRPEQYLWSYKRFKTAPPGEPTPYRTIWSRRRLRRNPFPPS